MDWQQKFEREAACTPGTPAHNPEWSIEHLIFAVEHMILFLYGFYMAEKENKRLFLEQRKLTLIVFLKFLGSSGSSKGYEPTNITYNVTPQDQTSAI